MLASSRQLDPPGVGARDLRECLLLQLEDGRSRDTSPIASCAKLRRADQPPLERDLQALRRSRPATCRTRPTRSPSSIPSPGLQYCGGQRQLHHPRPGRRQDRRRVPRLPERHQPAAPAHFARSTRRSRATRSKFEGENKEFISSKLNSANWMIQAIEQRRQTMLKVMNYIVDRQREFFEKGVQYLKPLTLREVAERHQHARDHGQPRDEREVRADAARRAAAQVLLLERPDDHDGRGRRRRGIKAQIQKLVEDEDTKTPLTDQAIVEHLRPEGRPDRPPHGRQVPRPAGRPVGPHAQAGMSLATDRCSFPRSASSFPPRTKRRTCRYSWSKRRQALGAAPVRL